MREEIDAWKSAYNATVKMLDQEIDALQRERCANAAKIAKQASEIDALKKCADEYEAYIKELEQTWSRSIEPSKRS